MGSHLREHRLIDPPRDRGLAASLRAGSGARHDTRPPASCDVLRAFVAGRPVACAAVRDVDVEVLHRHHPPSIRRATEVTQQLGADVLDGDGHRHVVNGSRMKELMPTGGGLGGVEDQAADSAGGPWWGRAFRHEGILPSTAACSGARQLPVVVPDGGCMSGGSSTDLLLHLLHVRHIHQAKAVVNARVAKVDRAAPDEAIQQAPFELHIHDPV